MSKLKKTFIICILLFFAATISAAAINIYVISFSEKHIFKSFDKDAKYDCILILGCGVREDGTPSNMLSDRLRRGIELYKLGAAPKIIMSGDHGQKDYDEVNVMRQIALDNNVPAEDIFMDHAGFSTYDSMYRAKAIFEADNIIVVTQKYHLYRALYDAWKLGIDAQGFDSDYHVYAGQKYRDIRELAARVKDFFACIIKPEPKYLGDVIPVSGDGTVTNDKRL